MIGIVKYYLPGVFLKNPAPQVNAQLWTLPYETILLHCDIATFLSSDFYQSTRLLIVACAILQLTVMVLIYLRVQVDEGTVRGPVLVLSVPVWISALPPPRQDHVELQQFHSPVSRFGSVLLYFPIINALAALPAAYFTVYLGLMNPGSITHSFSSGDYSYGIFLYGFPIQQAVSAAFPEFRVWWFNLIVSAPIVFLTAYASWHWVGETRASATSTTERARAPLHGCQRRHIRPLRSGDRHRIEAQMISEAVAQRTSR
jgi:peptidoglycan/LPS O-acetylase OafA/YrhL